MIFLKGKEKTRQKANTEKADKAKTEKDKSQDRTHARWWVNPM
jgi:hypothetical protein